MTSRRHCAAKSVALLEHGRSHIFEAPTGWGKTVVGGVIAARVGQPTLIVVTKEDLMHQWRDSLVNVLGVSPALVGQIQQDVCDWQGKQFVLGMVQSLIIPDRYPAEMYKYFGLQILDEVPSDGGGVFRAVLSDVLGQAPAGVQCDTDTQGREDPVAALAYWTDSGPGHHP